MDLADRLITLKKKVMARVVEAAGNHDTRLVAAYSALATRIEELWPKFFKKSGAYH